MQHWALCSQYTENHCVLITVCDRALQRNYIELLATPLMAAQLPQTCQFNFPTTQPSAVLNYTVTLWEWHWHLTTASREVVSWYRLYYVYSKTWVELASASGCSHETLLDTKAHVYARLWYTGDKHMLTYLAPISYWGIMGSGLVQVQLWVIIGNRFSLSSRWLYGWPVTHISVCVWVCACGVCERTRTSIRIP